MLEVVDWVRKTFTEGDDVRDAGLETPEDIVRTDNIIYGENSKWQLLDLYRPKAAENRALPVIVSIHGGAWVYGDKERYQYYCMNLAQKGFAVVNFTYRLAPEYKYPAPLEDTNSVFSWVMKNAEKYGMDTDQIFAVGDSAGAHILSLYAAICLNSVYADEYEFDVPEGLQLRAIALNCGMYDMKGKVESQEFDLTQSLMKEFLPKQGTEEELEKISVVHYMTREYPPVYLMTAVADFLRGQAFLLEKRLTEYGIPHIFRIYGDKEKKLAHVFHLDIRSEDAEICNKEEIEFFRSYSGGKV